MDDTAELSYPAPPGTCVSDARTDAYRALAAPEPSFVEECYEHDMTPGADGYVRAAVLNRAAGLGVYQRYRRDQLPHHITWRQLGSGTYVVAMEPSTNRDAGRFDARERGELGFLAPGEERHYELEIGALTGAAVDRVRRRGGAARGGPGRGAGMTVATAAPPRLSAGILTADLTRLGAELELLRGRAEYAHVDVMDGSFCPQLTVGPAFIAAAASTGVPVDAHLLVDEPARFLPEVVRPAPRS